MKYKLTKYIKNNILITILLLIVTYCDLKLPDYMAKIIDIGIVNKDLEYIYKIGGYMIIYALIGLCANIISGYFSSILSNKISHDIRYDLYNKVINLDNNLLTTSSSSLINRLTIDVYEVNSGLFIILRIIIMAPIIALFASIKILNTNKKMAYILLISILIMSFIIIILFKKVLPKLKKAKILLDKLNLVSKENIKGIKTIKAFNRIKNLI